MTSSPGMMATDMKTHASLIFSAAMLAFAVEGWQGTIGETLAHSMGVNKSLLGAIIATIITYIYSLLYDHPDTPRKPKQRKPPRSKSR